MTANSEEAEPVDADRCFVGLKLAGGVCNGREIRAKKIFKGEDGLSVRASAGEIVNEEIIKA